jgi:hypothetical protein
VVGAGAVWPRDAADEHEYADAPRCEVEEISASDDVASAEDVAEVHAEAPKDEAAALQQVDDNEFEKTPEEATARDAAAEAPKDEAAAAAPAATPAGGAVVAAAAAAGPQVAAEAHGEDQLFRRIRRKLKQAATQDARASIWAEVAEEVALTSRQILQAEEPGGELLAAEETAASFFSKFDRVLQLATDHEADQVWSMVAVSAGDAGAPPVEAAALGDAACRFVGGSRSRSDSSHSHSPAGKPPGCSQKPMRRGRRGRR